MLLVQPLLHREREADADLPGVHRAVLDDRGDAGDVGLPDAVDRGRRARHGETDGVLDRVRRRTGERDRLLDHRALLPPSTIGLASDGDASYGPAVARLVALLA